MTLLVILFISVPFTFASPKTDVVSTTLASLGVNVQKIESNIFAIQQEIQETTQTIDETNRHLEKVSEDLKIMSTTMQRMNRFPPLHFINPDGSDEQDLSLPPIQNAQEYVFLSWLWLEQKIRAHITEYLQLKKAILSLQSRQTELQNKKSNLEKNRQNFYKKIHSQIDIKNTILASDHSSSRYKDMLSKIQDASEIANSFPVLFGHIEIIRTLDALEQHITNQSSDSFPLLFSAALQSLPILPVSGQRRDDDLIHKDDVRRAGFTMKSLRDSVVLSPQGGYLVFSGEFNMYENVIIIDHENGYYSLIFGVESILQSPLSFIKKGEPLGFMSSSSEQSEIYMTIFYHSSPINPNLWFPLE